MDAQQTTTTAQSVRNDGAGGLKRGPVHAVLDSADQTWCGRKMRVRARWNVSQPVALVTCPACSRALAQDQPRAYRRR